MNDRQIKIIKESFELVSKIPAETVGNLFYNRLFEIAPEVKPMFGNTEMAEQSRNLIAMLGYIINKLDNLDSIIDEVAKLAKRHVKYGVEPKHYQPVGLALHFTLEKGLGTIWNAELASAWSLCYSTLSGAMIAACEEIDV